ncbi:MAG: hypothetical protein J6J71_04610 [Prevotella sp.]|nr:hypothetical protein [Prevotella sp.]
MITLSAKIELISGANEGLEVSDVNYSIGYIGLYGNGNNISSEISNVVGKKIKSKNPFIIGASKLSDGSTFSNGEEYYIGKQLSNSDGNFENAYAFKITSSEEISSLTIAFDVENNGHPQYLQLGAGESAEYFEDDDATFNIYDETYISKAQELIRIGTWNRPFYPIVISGIYVGLNIEIDKRNLLSMERTIASRSNFKFPSYGIISNTGHIDFSDIDGEMQDYVREMLLKSNVSVKFFLNDTIAKTNHQICDYNTKDWNYDNDSRVVSVSLKDDLEDWQEIYIEGFSFDPRNPNFVLKNKTMGDLYTFLHERTPEKYKMLALSELDESTVSILNQTTIPYPFLKNGSLWSQWQKLCEACGLYIFKNSEGRTTCYYDLGS